MNVPKELRRMVLSQKNKDSLSLIKRRTGIQKWNVLCRWAMCISLAESAPPRQEAVPSDSNLEMSWDTFAGDNSDVFFALLKERCVSDKIEPTDSEVARQCMLHINRGIAYMSTKGKVGNIRDLIQIAVEDSGEKQED